MTTDDDASGEKDGPPTDGQFLADVLDGLSEPWKTLPCKYFYDAEGSRLFERICELDEYYLTRTEIALLEAKAGEIAALLGPGVSLIEFGAGSLTKIRILLSALEAPAAFIPVDIALDHLTGSVDELNAHFPDLDIRPVRGDFTRPLVLPDIGVAGGRRAGFFPGSTIGNFDHAGAEAFLAALAETLGPGALFIVGVDTKKDAGVIERAYDDADGVTAAFILNLLARINRELGGDFDLGRFRHRALYDADEGRVEMHLESLEAQRVRVGDTVFDFAAGETIHTENSYKYAIDEFADLAGRAGYASERVWTDDATRFAIHALRVQ